MLTIDCLERTPPSRWDITVVADLAERDPALLIGERDGVTHLIEQPAFARVGCAAVVDDDGRPVGVVSLTDIQRTVHAAHLCHNHDNQDGPANLTSR